MQQHRRNLSDASQQQSAYAWFWRIILLVTATAAVLRVLLFIFYVQTTGLMLDFSTYYTAGKVLNAGLAPYLNHVLADSALWDGAALNEYSRFLYPPLTGNVFQLLALLPYAHARLIWQLVTLLTLAGSLILTARLLQPAWQLNQWLIIITFNGYFFPLLTHLERGQVDAITLFLIMTGLFMMQRYEADKRGYLAGFMFAAATWIKPYSVLLLPFLALQRKWKALAGTLIAAGGMLLLSVALNGLPQVSAYYLEELPRMNVSGEGENILTHYDMITLTETSDRDFTYAHGRHWRLSALEFSQNASLARLLYNLDDRVGIAIPRATYSALVFGLAFLYVLFRQRRHFPDVLSKPAHMLMYWQVALISILLAAPMTWTMNTVWLLPSVWLFLYTFQQSPHDRKTSRQLAIIALCMIVVAAPVEHSVVPVISKSFLPQLRFVLAEIVLFFTWLSLLKADLSQRMESEESSHVH